ncbi:MAG: ribosomal protein S18-alanine N-acetyltransferase [Deltaproteobacteria bacterium]|nr:ribosomal protein S18-alanine N-acetyltransferase [Deltaproteobacteria bacterium]
MLAEDLEAVLQIERASFVAPWSQQMFEDELRLSQSQTFVAKNEDRIVGFICFWTLPGELQILNIAVDPSVRKRGIASDLLRIVLNLAEEKKVREITLESRASNGAALSLYRKFGFQICGRRKGYYHEEGEDALLLILRR